ncbi:MAG: UDP-glucose/GDP-mannose dehydrogenase family protein [Syntrophales bacterium]|nr:UDP-glucose/GDP-mannose dehydrogenase family protein [Syntrophales bacterium]MDD5231777.1 UDP-glucose/GDP-mannose dehydrogenase family protein [Syntrophales bacterium]HPL63873.1 UDP-glucose/GDP-mannose dehydrogenase family protein [Syntrophales bacterium]
MKIGIIGTGYVGLVAAACFAHMGNDVTCVDIDEKKIDELNRGIVPIFEPGLETFVKKNREDGRLVFTTELADAVDKSLFLFIAVGTPPDENGAADLKHVLDVASGIGETMTEYKIIINKSTVPVGTADQVRETIRGELKKRNLHIEFDVVSNPEFMKEGDSINDFMKPDRVIIGTDNPRTAELMKEIYAPFAMDREKMIVMDVRSAELTKYAANAMLATRISFMNEMANICERVGADISKVRLGIGSDRRIGYSFIYPGIGYGGSCFPKDVRALISTAGNCEYDTRILKSVEEVNIRQRRIMADKIIAYYSDKGTVAGKTGAVWGLAFKPNTDDVRESPAIEIIRALLAHGANIRTYDPEAAQNAKSVLGEDPRVRYFNNPYEALEGSDFLALATEWHLFRNPDFNRMKKLMKSPVLFDGRNQYDPAEMKERGFVYTCIGRC